MSTTLLSTTLQIFKPTYGPDVYHQIAPDNPLLCLSWLAYKYEPACVNHF